ncbi:MAG: hypothetical protein RIT28_5143 [Pseudomonadota bacterium]
MRRCPMSGEEMTQEVFHTVTIDRSPHGVWLDKGELFRIAEDLRDETDWKDYAIAIFHSWFAPQARPEEHGEGTEERGLPCPICSEPMHRDTYRDTYIDRCDKHGVWLDAGELELILQRLRHDRDFLRGIRLRLSEVEL